VRIKYVSDYIEQPRKVRSSRSFHFDIDEITSNRSIFNLLNDKDRDILYLIFVSKKKQKEVQRVLKRSQPSLCYDIRRIRERIQFIAYLRQAFDIFTNFIEQRNRKYDPQTIEILVLMYYTTSFTLTARVLGLSQIFVRGLFDKALRRMRRLKHWEAYEIFSAVRRNKNKVKRVYKDHTVWKS